MSSAQPPNPSSTIVGNCVACGGLVRVPAKANANASVRCPHCQQTFALIKLLENAVPEVEIIQQPQMPPTTPAAKPDLYIDQTTETGKDATGKFVVPSQLAKGARRRKSSRSKSGRSRSHSSSSSSSRRSEPDASPQQSRNAQPPREANYNEGEQAFANDPSEPLYSSTIHTGTPPDPVGAESIHPPQQSSQYAASSSHDEQRNQTHRSTRHRDSRAARANDSTNSPGNDFLKILTGAGLALPIAYLIVMWVFVRDPLGIGKGLGSRVPFLVPSALRAKVDSDKTPMATDSEHSDWDDAEQLPVDANFELEKVESEVLNIGKEALRGMNDK